MVKTFVICSMKNTSLRKLSPAIGEKSPDAGSASSSSRGCCSVVPTSATSSGDSWNGVAWARRGPQGVLNGSGVALETARERLIAMARTVEAAELWPLANAADPEPGARILPLTQGLEDALLLLCAAPLATVAELARFGLIPTSMHDRVEKLVKWGVVDLVSHCLGSLGRHAQRRNFLQKMELILLQRQRTLPRRVPVFPPVVWLLARDLDAVAVLYTLNSQASRVGSLDREDWAELGVEIGGDPLGAPAYHPRALLCVWLYSFMTGVRSCRKLEAACRDQIPYPWLTGWQHPDHNTLWRFYKERQRRINLTDGDAPD